MRSKKRDKLDLILGHWASRHSPERFKVDRLRQGILEALSGDQPSVEGESTIPLRTTSRGHRVAWLSLSAAALLLISSAVWFVHRPPAHVAELRDDSDQAPPSSAWLHEQQLAGQATLFSEVERVFDNRVEWIAEIDGQVRLGLNEEQTPSEVSPPLAVRVVVVRRQVGADAKPIWTADLVARGERVVQVTSDDDDGMRLLIWAYPLPDGKIVVDSKLELQGAVTIDSSTSGLQESGVPTSVYTARLGGEEYDVYQTVALMSGKVQ